MFWFLFVVVLVLVDVVVYSMFVGVRVRVISIDERRLSCLLTMFSSFLFFSFSFVFMEVYSFLFVSRECKAVKQRQKKKHQLASHICEQRREETGECGTTTGYVTLDDAWSSVPLRIRCSVY